MSLKIPRRTYAALYGPTTGDRIRLADTDLLIEIEHDFTRYCDEVTFGGGKVIRDGMGQSAGAERERKDGALDLVITNAVILDHWGVVKGDIGIKNGRIVKVGKAGNPDTMEAVDPELVVGAATEVIAGENLIVSAGGVDSHIRIVHEFRFSRQRQCRDCGTARRANRSRRLRPETPRGLGHHARRD